ncbi:hypothetical protein B0F90DRAFT_659213 [Multifurca ochricompacta]|uniref:ATPase inhibitor, mitochondrial n=1 Tax=Multifurca ochricompacta TaxID=376703 RepID=A0AAD4M233_9AGAM|nr:hypothetical protein B0F90DRAFT_659213 [Multifurca ochricompacta]
MPARIALRQVSFIAKASVRSYTSSVKEGSVASSREFGKKEKAHEDQYIKQEERKKLQKLKAEVFDKKKAELAELQRQHDEYVGVSCPRFLCKRLRNQSQSPPCSCQRCCSLLTRVSLPIFPVDTLCVTTALCTVNFLHSIAAPNQEVQRK